MSVSAAPLCKACVAQATWATSLDTHRDSRYTLSVGIMGAILVDTVTVADAVSTAVRHPPSGLGSVASGAA